MPQLDGIETTKIIRSMEHSVFSKLPIVALTANISAKDIKDYLDVGMNDFISKPIDKHSFLQKCASYFISATSNSSTVDALDMDFTNLETIAENNIEMLNEMLLLYFKEYQQWKTNILVVLKNNNTKEALKIIHKFKSSLNLVGAMEAKKMLIELETSIELKKNNVDELLKKLIPVIEEGNQLLKQKFNL